MATLGRLSIAVMVVFWHVRVSGVGGDLVVPGIGSRSNVVVANIGDINIGYQASPHQDIVLTDLCKPAKISTICGLTMAMRYAIDKVNADDTLLPNITLGYVALDDCHSALKALGISVYFVPEPQTTKSTANDTCDAAAEFDNGFRGPTNQLRHFDVAAVVGPTTSSSASLAASFLSLFRVPQIGNYATSDTLSDKTIYEYFMRMVSPDSVQVKAMLDLCKFFGWSYVSFVYSEGSYGENAATFMDHFLRDKSSGYGICLAVTIKISSDAQQSDINAVVDTLFLYPNARVVLLFLADAHVAGFFQAARTIAGVGRFLWLGADFLTVFEGTSDENTPLGGFFFDHPSIVVPGLVDYINTVSLLDDNNVWNNEIWESTYRCSLKDVYNVTGRGCAPGAKLNSFICPLQVPESCRMYDSVYVIAHALHNLITDRCPTGFTDITQLKNCVQGKQLLRYLLNITLDGMIGRIQFDASGNLRENLVLKQFYQKTSSSYGAMLAGVWNALDARITVNDATIDWTYYLGVEDNRTARGGATNKTNVMSVCSLSCMDNEYIIHGNIPCCWSCQTCRDNEIVSTNRTGCQLCPTLYWPDVNGTACEAIRPTFLALSNPISACLLVTGGIGTLFSLMVMSVYVAKRRHKLVRATYVPLSMVILLGTFIVSVSVVVYVLAPDSRAICVTRSIGFHCGINLIYSPLFVKNILIYRIFNSGAHMITHTSAKTQMVTTIVVTVVIQWMLTGVSEYISTSTASLRMPSSYDKYVELYCYKSTIWFLIPLVYNILLMLVCAVIGFLTRKLPENFNESWFIFVSVSTTLFAWVVFIPAYFTSYYAYMQSAILGFCLVLNALVTLGCQFVPIIYAVVFVPPEKITFSKTFKFDSEFSNVSTRMSVAMSTSVSTINGDK